MIDDLRLRFHNQLRPSAWADYGNEQIHPAIRMGPIDDSVGKFKKWGKIPQTRPFSLLGGENNHLSCLRKIERPFESRISQQSH